MTTATLVDCFIHPVHFDTGDSLRRARLFVRCCFMSAFFCVIYAGFNILFEFERGVSLVLLNMSALLLLPFCCKTRMPVSWLGNLHVFITGTLIVSITCYSGGVWSAAYPWIVALPVSALLIVNRRSGMVWGVIFFGVMLLFPMLDYHGVTFPVEYNPEMKALRFMAVLPGLLSVLLLFAYIFDMIQSDAIDRLENKNELLEQQQEIISEQSASLEKMLGEEEDFIRIIAHDLKSPLHNISSLVKLIEKEKDTDKIEGLITMVAQSSSSAQNLIQKIMEMYHSNRGNVKINHTSVDVVPLVEGIREMLWGAAKRKNIEINIVNECLKGVISADHTYLALIFENIISNAIKFSKKGTKIDILTYEDDFNLIIKISDEGPGINISEEKKLFKKFSKLSARPTGGESSSGLGLSLVRQYVELLGGKVWFERNEVVGVSFIVELPFLVQE